MGAFGRFFFSLLIMFLFAETSFSLVPEVFRSISRQGRQSLQDKLQDHQPKVLLDLAKSSHVSVDFDSFGLSNEDVVDLLDRQIIHNKTRFIDLQKNSDIDDSAFDMLIERTPNLQNFSFIYTSASADFAGRVLTKLKKLRRLQVNQLASDQFPAISSHPRLTLLNISNSGLSQEEVITLICDYRPRFLREIIVRLPQDLKSYERLRDAAVQAKIKLTLRLHEEDAYYLPGVNAIHDGDTFAVTLPSLGGFGAMLKGIRLYSVDTPEIQKHQKGFLVDPYEEKMGWAAKNFVQYHLSKAESIHVRDGQAGKYFRLLADVLVKNPSHSHKHILLSNLLVKNRLAVRYFGKTKPVINWTKIYLENSDFYDYWFNYEDYNKTYKIADINSHPFKQRIEASLSVQERVDVCEQFYRNLML